MVKFEELIEKHTIDVATLPEKILRKIENFDDLYAQYQDSTDGSAEERDLELKLKSLDDGITNDLESYIQSQSKGDGGKSDDASSQPASNDTPPKSNEESNSNWMFWM
jgi:hypothetical protein